MVEVIEYTSRDALAAGLAGCVATDMRAALAAGGTATLAVPGGTTPGPFLAALAMADLDWPAVTVMAGDERWVPPSDERSNEALVRKSLIAKTGAAFLPFWREGADIASAAKALDAAIRPMTPLTSVVIGMGGDMHCASLFPGVAGLAAAMDGASGTAIMALPSTVMKDGAPEWRLTLTASALSNAGTVRLLITGEDKRAVLQQALAEQDPLIAPVGAVLRRARKAEVHWAA